MSFDPKAAAEARRRLMEQAAETAIKRVQYGNAKPTLKRYSWSRLHTDLLDDNRWSLVALRAQAPLPFVEALVTRLEIHANKSVPRGYVGDFDAEAMAARWGVEADMVGRILDELERPQLGWIDQEQIVSFWDRNPDKVDETAAKRMQRMRDRKKGMRRLAELSSRGLITEAQRHEREVALKNSKEPAELIAAWTEPDALRRNAVTVTTRADQIIKQNAAGTAAQAPPSGESLASSARLEFADKAKALQWLQGEGEAILMRRCQVMKSKAGRMIQRWSVTLGDVTQLAEIILASSATSAQGAAFEDLVVNGVARRATERLAPGLPFPPMAIKGG